MDSNLTVNTLAFNLVYSDRVDGSLRREISRGASLPTELLIKHQNYVDSKTKVAGKRSVLRIDYYMALTGGVIAPVSMYTVLAAPTDALVTAGITNAMSAMLVNVVHGTTNTNGLDLKDEIFANKEQ
jgi:predicted membrane-bound spermidine synthase